MTFSQEMGDLAVDLISEMLIHEVVVARPWKSNPHNWNDRCHEFLGYLKSGMLPSKDIAYELPRWVWLDDMIALSACLSVLAKPWGGVLEMCELVRVMQLLDPDTFDSNGYAEIAVNHMAAARFQYAFVTRRVVSEEELHAAISHHGLSGEIFACAWVNPNATGSGRASKLHFTDAATALTARLLFGGDDA